MRSPLLPLPAAALLLAMGCGDPAASPPGEQGPVPSDGAANRVVFPFEDAP